MHMHTFTHKHTHHAHTLMYVYIHIRKHRHNHTQHIRYIRWNCLNYSYGLLENVYAVHYVLQVIQLCFVL